jgi:presenilin-like A22 family membrane protease
MKHSLSVTILLVVMFFVAQVVGLGVILGYTPVERTIDPETQEVVVSVAEEPLPLGFERPPASGAEIVVIIVVAILFGTGLILLLMKLRQHNLWKLWFLMATILMLTFAFTPWLRRWLGGMGESIALTMAVILGLWKVFRPNVVVQLSTETFVYGGLAAFFVTPKIMTSIWVPVALLLLISLYDIYAVWKSGHMVKLAKFQTNSKVFAGLFVPYKKPKQVGSAKAAMTSEEAPGVKEKVKTAVLGGGDIGFPLIFTGVLFQQLVLEHPVPVAFLMSLIISVCAAAALLTLLLKAQKDKFYPAMPFITAGCLIGYAIVALV